MTDDELFRLMFIILAAAFMPCGAYHRIRSHTGEKIDRWQEGVVILFGLRLTALVMFAAGIAWMIDPQLMAWSSMPLPIWLRWIGFFMAACAGVLWVWTIHTLGKNLTDTVVTRKDHSLVTSGPYRWVRHPFYVAMFIGGAGGCLAIANWLFVVLGGMLMGFLVARTRIEEDKLIERFGDEYRDFMRRTGRFFPRLTAGE